MKAKMFNFTTSAAAIIVFCLIGIVAVIAVFALFHIMDPVTEFVLKSKGLHVLVVSFFVVLLGYNRFFKKRHIL